MAIIVGNAQDSVRTGLAGRIANAIVAAVDFYSVTYASGSKHLKGLNALVQGIVDGLNNDKVDATSQLAGAVQAACTTAAGQSIPNVTATIVNFGTVEYDSDSAVTTGASWHFTVPTGKGGKYEVEAMVTVVPAAVLTDYLLQVFVNGAEKRRLKRMNPNNNGIAGHCGSTKFIAAAGDTIDVRIYQNSGGAQPLESVAASNWITITRVAGS